MFKVNSMSNFRNTIYYAGFNLCPSLKLIIFKTKLLDESGMQWKFDPIADEIYAAVEQQIDTKTRRHTR